MGYKPFVFNGRIPTDISRIIISHVDRFTVKSLPRVCKQFYNITKEKDFYVNRLAKDYPMFSISTKCNPSDCHFLLSKMFSFYPELLVFLQSKETTITIWRKPRDKTLELLCDERGLNLECIRRANLTRNIYTFTKSRDIRRIPMTLYKLDYIENLIFAWDSTFRSVPPQKDTKKKKKEKKKKNPHDKSYCDFFSYID